MRRHLCSRMVLDHEGQILTHPMYKLVVRGQGGGGPLVDGNAGVQYGTVVDNPATGTSITLSGLTREIPTQQRSISKDVCPRKENLQNYWSNCNR